jgi:hypothetical protein
MGNYQKKTWIVNKHLNYQLSLKPKQVQNGAK